VKKEDQDITLLNSDISLNNDYKKDSFKTTNVNILLNRVRLTQKTELKKRIIILLTLFSLLFIVGFFYLS
jgi:hypothetical protein